MMELRLILEVEKRPMLYDKEVSVYKKQNVRDEAWREVATILKISEPECRKKWRGLRDQFIKIYRNEQTNGPSKRRAPWIYYKQMLFLVPHIGMKEIESFQITLTILMGLFQGIVAFGQTPHIEINESCGFWKNASDPGGGVEEEPKVIIRSPMTSDSQEEPSPKQCKRKHLESEEERTPARGDDPDEQFLLSYLPTLKRFTPRQNALARMRIQQVLYEIEFGSEENDNVNSYEMYLSPHGDESIKNE